MYIRIQQSLPKHEVAFQTTMRPQSCGYLPRRAPNRELPEEAPLVRSRVGTYIVAAPKKRGGFTCSCEKERGVIHLSPPPPWWESSTAPRLSSTIGPADVHSGRKTAIFALGTNLRRYSLDSAPVLHHFFSPTAFACGGSCNNGSFGGK